MYRNHPFIMKHMIPLGACRLLLSLLCGSVLMSAHDAQAKPRRRAPKTTPVPQLPEASRSAAQGVYQDLREVANADVRLAVTQGLIELGGEDRQAGIDRGLKASESALRVVAIEEIFKDRKGLKALIKTAEQQLWDLLVSKEKNEHEEGVRLLRAHFDKRSQAKWVKRLLASGSTFGAQFARAKMIEEGGRQAWKVIEKGLKAPQDSPEHTQALEAMKAKRYKEAKSWALSHSADKGVDGEVARAWLEGIPTQQVRRMNQDLIKQYRKAEGDFPRRVRFAHLLASRGELSAVRDTLVIAVKNKKGRIKEELDTAQLRVMGWEGLKKCRDHKVLESVKGMMVNLQNREEAIPAVAWLEDWVRDTNDPSAKKLLEEMSQQTQYVSRLESIKALGSLRLRGSLPIIQEALSTGNEDLRIAAAEGLAKMVIKGDEALIDEALANERRSDAVRVALLEGLARIGTRETLKTAKLWLYKGKGEVKKAALEALARIPLGKDQLELIFSAKYRNAPDKEIRMRVWELLIKAKSDKLSRDFTSAFSWLEEQQLRRLAQLTPFPEELMLKVAIGANQALSLVALELLASRGESALPTLMKVFEQSNEPKVIVRATEHLRALKQAEGMPTYLSLLKSRDDIVRAVGLDALRVYGGDAERQVARDMIDNERAPLPRAQAGRAFVAISLRAPAPAPTDEGSAKSTGKDGNGKGAKDK